MEIKIFISYFNDDNKKMQMLKSLIDSTENLIPIVISDSRKTLVPLTKKVADGIRESQIIIPILTSNSISSQWVNQEIGFASALSDIKVMPIIENSIIDKLKGFIHKQVDLSYNYQNFPGNRRKESLHFKKCIVNLINDIKEEYHLGQPINDESNLLETESSEKYFEKGYLDNALKIYDPTIQLNLSIMAFTKNNSGILSYWVKVQSHHNEERQEKRKLYIASAYSNNYMAAPKLAQFPNMWAIYRETPTTETPNGKWKFECNGEREGKTVIETNEILKEGWHLFSVEWSIQMDFIKFYIDTKLIGKKRFANWPEDSKMSMYIGTWPDKNPKNQFYAPISAPLFSGILDPRIIKEQYDFKPNKTTKIYR